MQCTAKHFLKKVDFNVNTGAKFQKYFIQNNFASKMIASFGVLKDIFQVELFSRE